MNKMQKPEVITSGFFMIVRVYRPLKSRDRHPQSSR